MENECDHFLTTEKRILNLARLGGVIVEKGGRQVQWEEMNFAKALSQSVEVLWVF